MKSYEELKEKITLFIDEESKETFDEKYRYVLNLNPLPNDWVAFLFNIVLECEKNKNYEEIIGLQKY